MVQVLVKESQRLEMARSLPTYRAMSTPRLGGAYVGVHSLTMIYLSEPGAVLEDCKKVLDDVDVEDKIHIPVMSAPRQNEQC